MISLARVAEDEAGLDPQTATRAHCKCSNWWTKGLVVGSNGYLIEDTVLVREVKGGQKGKYEQKYTFGSELRKMRSGTVRWVVL